MKALLPRTALLLALLPFGASAQNLRPYYDDAPDANSLHLEAKSKVYTIRESSTSEPPRESGIPSGTTIETTRGTATLSPVGRIFQSKALGVESDVITAGTGLTIQVPESSAITLDHVQMETQGAGSDATVVGDDSRLDLTLHHGGVAVSGSNELNLDSPFGTIKVQGGRFALRTEMVDAGQLIWLSADDDVHGTISTGTGTLELTGDAEGRILLRPNAPPEVIPLYGEVLTPQEQQSRQQQAEEAAQERADRALAALGARWGETPEERRAAIRDYYAEVEEARLRDRQRYEREQREDEIQAEIYFGPPRDPPADSTLTSEERAGIRRYWNSRLEVEKGEYLRQFGDEDAWWISRWLTGNVDLYGGAGDAGPDAYPDADPGADLDADLDAELDDEVWGDQSGWWGAEPDPFTAGGERGTDGGQLILAGASPGTVPGTPVPAASAPGPVPGPGPGTATTVDAPDGALVAYSLHRSAGGLARALAEGTVADAASNDVITYHAVTGTLAAIVHDPGLFGSCGPCRFSVNTTFTDLGSNATHGANWGTVLPPYDFSEPPAVTVNGPMNYVRLDSITPRASLPGTGITTFNNVLGATAPYHDTLGAGTLNAFSLTVNFNTAQITNALIAGQFGPGVTFNFTENGGPFTVRPAGTFTAPVSGNCNGCGGLLFGNIAGGFTSGGTAIGASYGISGFATGITGSVLVTP